jgi:sulfonate transport system substrate-binding protein
MAIRVGVNAHDPMVYFLAPLGLLERELEPLGETVQWSGYAPGYRAPEFLGKQLDFVGCGQTPMLTAQADGLPVVYVAGSPKRPNQGALLVAADSPFQTPADLAGQRVALALGAWPTQFVAVALEDAGSSLREVEVVAPPEDALGALLRGELAAWAALGPRLVEAEESGRVRRLIATEAAISNRALWTVQRSFARDRLDVIEAILTAIEKANHWVIANRSEAARLRARDRDPQAAAWGGDARSWEIMLGRMPWAVAPIEADFIAEQQHAADVLHRAGLLEHSIDVDAAFLPELAGLVQSAQAAALPAG